MPFLGVHFTKRINGSVEAGPNAVLALKREGYSKTSFALGDALGTLTYPGFWKMSAKYWQTGMNEQYRSMVKSVFVKSLQTLVPEVRGEDLYAPGPGYERRRWTATAGCSRTSASPRPMARYTY